MIDLKTEYYDILTDIFNSYCPKAQIWAYGSRIKNASHSGSDLDLTVKSFNEDGKYLYELKELLNNNNIPFLVDINEFEKLPQNMQDEIKREYIEIFPNNRQEVRGKNSDWRECLLGDIVLINPAEYLKKGEYAIKIPMDVLQPFCKKILDYSVEKYNGGTKFRNGDTIMARITPCLENGKIAKVDILNNDEIGFGSTEYIVFRAIKDKTDSDYLYYLVISSQIREPAIKSMVGSSGRQRVQTDVVKGLHINLPPLETQHKIAKILSALDDKIELNNKINENLEQQAQAIFKSWFIDFEPFGRTMPEDWQNTSLLKNPYISILKPGINVFNGEKYYIATADVNENSIINRTTLVSMNNRPSRANMQPCINSIWFAKMKDSKKNILINKIWIKEVDKFLLSTGFYGFRCLEDYLYYIWCFISSDAFNVMKNNLCSGTIMEAINNDGLEKINLLIPPLDILKKFNCIVKNMFELIATNKFENENLTQLRDTLLPKLMNGEISVENIEV